MAERLKEIADIEKIEISESSLLEISKLSDGSLRDAIGILKNLYRIKVIKSKKKMCINCSVQYLEQSWQKLSIW